MHKKNRRQSHIPGLGQRGYTLVELLVTFALFAIFMTAVVMCLPGITKIYMQLQQINHEQTICNTVSNEIKTQLQGILGVEGDGDPLGIKNGNGLGYLALLDESGTQIQLTPGSADTSGPAVLPDADISGTGIEFAYMNGIIAQMDTNGFNGYTMRKNKLQMDYHDAHAIAQGALVTRYYEADIEKHTRTTTIDYRAAEGSYSAASGITVSDGTQNVTYAIQYPYVSSFYEGFDLKTTFTIKKAACYTAGAGTTESPSRIYVNYVNYTLSLFKDGQLRYSQDYVVNIQNAVPYQGTTVAVKPQEPDQPEEPEYGDHYTYIKPGSLEKVGQDGADDQLTRQGYYYFTIHIGDSVYNNNFHDYWEITLPEGIKLNGAYFCDNDGSVLYYSPVFEMVVDRNNNKIKLKLKAGIGFINISEFKIGLQVQSTDGTLFDDKMDSLDGTKALKMEQRIPLANTSNANISCNVFNNHITVQIAPTVEQTKSYVKLEFDSEVDQVNAMYNTTNLLTRVDGRYVYLYARVTDLGGKDQIDLEPTFTDGQQHELVSVVVGGSSVDIHR